MLTIAPAVITTIVRERGRNIERPQPIPGHWQARYGDGGNHYADCPVRAASLALAQAAHPDAVVPMAAMGGPGEGRTKC